MKILVCIKQVPDLASRLKPGAAGVCFADTDLAFRMNEYDEYAVNKDKDAPIGEVADLLVVADLMQFVPALTAELQ